MTHYDPRDWEPEEDPDDGGDSKPVIVWALVLVAGAIIFCLVMAWPKDAKSAPINPPNELVLSTANVVMQGQGEAIGCPHRGWTVTLANGVTINAASIAHREDTKATEVRPALQQCVLKDSFE